MGVYQFRAMMIRKVNFMDDQSGIQIQETRRDQRPARMVGLSVLDSATRSRDASTLYESSFVRDEGER